jgi:uncharacterized membrane protein
MVYNSLLFVTIILFVISCFITGASKIACTIAGYSCIAVAVLMILGYSLYFLTNLSNENNYSNFTYFKHLITVSGPFLILLGIVIYSLYLLITYQNRISEGQITTEYNTFSTISIALMLIEIYIFYDAMNTKLFNTTGHMSKVTFSLMYLLGVINISCVLIMGTILKYYITDG